MGAARMEGGSVTSVIGIGAAACTTFSFVPQILKIRRQGGRDLSYGMLLFYLLGLGLWLVYGLRIRAAEIIGANLVGGSLVGLALVLKWRSELPRARGGMAGNDGA